MIHSRINHGLNCDSSLFHLLLEVLEVLDWSGFVSIAVQDENLALGQPLASGSACFEVAVEADGAFDAETGANGLDGAHPAETLADDGDPAAVNPGFFLTA